jgi:hypothetical protein
MAGAVVTAYLVADILCSDTPVSNQTFVKRTTDCCKRLSVEKITTFLFHTFIVAFRASLPRVSFVDIRERE